VNRTKSQVGYRKLTAASVIQKQTISPAREPFMDGFGFSILYVSQVRRSCPEMRLLLLRVPPPHLHLFSHLPLRLVKALHLAWTWR
jgi:hypothetical protein